MHVCIDRRMKEYVTKKLHGAGYFFKSLYWRLKRNLQLLWSPQVTQYPTIEPVQSKWLQPFPLDSFQYVPHFFLYFRFYPFSLDFQFNMYAHASTCVLT
jgi:hypothetical protein